MTTQDRIHCRDLTKVSMFNPLYDGDCVELDGENGGEVWVVKNRSGWQLRALSDNRLHPSIKDIFGTLEFMAAVFEHAKNY